MEIEQKKMGYNPIFYEITHLDSENGGPKNNQLTLLKFLFSLAPTDRYKARHFSAI